MISIDAKSSRHRLMMGLIAALAALCLLLVTTMGALADTVNIFDKAGVLNKSQVQSEAANLPYPVNIYTMNNFTGTETAFNQEAVRTLNDLHNPRLIVIAIDTHNKFLAIVGGKTVSTSNSVYSDAVNAFKSNYNGGDYTGATIAALRSLQSSLGAAPGSGQTNNAFSFGLLPLCLVGLLVLALIAIAGAVFMRRARMRVPPYPMGNPYQQPYNQGYPPNYSGPGYNQGPGMNPWAAGGLGAAAGGFIGYELGKEAGEEQAREQGNVGGGDFGGGAGGTFGGDGGGGDFGGGAGGDFGGGGGGDFGGGAGGDFGGGGGGSF